MARFATFLALVLFGTACGAKQQSTAGNDEMEEIVAAEEELVAELAEGCTAEVMADFGDVEPRSVVSKTIRVVNTTDEPIVLLAYETTCRCTTLELDQKPIGVGDSRDITLTFDSRGEWGGVGNFLSVETSNPECAMVVWMSANIEWK